LNQPSRIIVVGTSAGGVEALKTLASGLPADFPGAVCVVLHIPAHVPSMLGEILDRSGPLHALDARDGQPIRAGHIYVGVANRHLLIDGEVMRVTRGPKENRFRPSIDALFRSAAYTLGRRVVGVVLTGQLDDGSSGLWAIKDRGGVAIVQSPRDASFPSMPTSALQHVSIDHVVSLAALPQLLVRLVHEPLDVSPPKVETTMHTETEIAAGENPLQAGALRLGAPSRFTCPECHGVLSEVREGNIVRFRCHTGHAFSTQALLAEVDESIDTNLWNVLRSMQERSMLLREAALRARERSEAVEAGKLESSAVECDEQAHVIRNLLQDANAAASPISEVL
jgi:two-component system chemotaxis response regulator CheB